MLNISPSAVRFFLKPIPTPLLHRSMELSLNHIFQAYIRDGCLQFIEHRSVTVNVPDINLVFSVGLRGQRLAVLRRPCDVNVSVTANVSEYLLLASGQVDPDTLFFRRRLSITGDTELGLRLKNFLDTLEPETLLPVPLRWLTQAELLPKAFNDGNGSARGSIFP